MLSALSWVVVLWQSMGTHRLLFRIDAQKYEVMEQASLCPLSCMPVP